MSRRLPRQQDDWYRVGVRAIGRYLPARVVTNEELAARYLTSDAWIRKRIGTETRRFAAAGEWSSDLGLFALQDACAKAGLDVRSIDLVICGTYTPDHMVPGTAVAIMAKAGLEDTPGFDINSGGCPSGVFALDAGAKYVASGQYARVAVVLTDVSSKMFDPEDRTVGVILADAAACYLLEPTLQEPSIGGALLRSRPSGYWSLYVARETRLDASGKRKTSGFGDNFITMDGRAVWDLVTNIIPDFVRELLAKSGLTPDDVDFFAVHQANLRLVQAVLDGLEQPFTKTFTNISRVGNTAGASIPLVLREAADSGQLRPGHLALLVAFGGGFNYGATLVRWCGPADFAPLPDTSEVHDVE